MIETSSTWTSFRVLPGQGSTAFGGLVEDIITISSHVFVSGSHSPGVHATVYGDFWEKSTHFLRKIMEHVESVNWEVMTWSEEWIDREMF